MAYLDDKDFNLIKVRRISEKACKINNHMQTDIYHRIFSENTLDLVIRSKHNLSVSNLLNSIQLNSI